jgi:hypothetical protein
MLSTFVCATVALAVAAEYAATDPVFRDGGPPALPAPWPVPPGKRRQMVGGLALIVHENPKVSREAMDWAA